MPAKCFECQEIGHIAADCPAKLYASEMGDGKPAWCGQCDRETRLVYFRRDGQEAARRCTACHPRSTVLPVTYSKCKDCKHAVYAWDVRSRCGQHQPVGTHLRCRRPECQCHGTPGTA
jgi:zinc knuckle protein